MGGEEQNDVTGTYPLFLEKPRGALMSEKLSTNLKPTSAASPHKNSLQNLTGVLGIRILEILVVAEHST